MPVRKRIKNRRVKRKGLTDYIQKWHIIVGAIIAIIGGVTFILKVVGFSGETADTRLRAHEARIDALEARANKHDNKIGGISRVLCKSSDAQDRANASIAGVCWNGKDSTP